MRRILSPILLLWMGCTWARESKLPACPNNQVTRALLKYLSNLEDIPVVLRRVREKVKIATGGKQVPWDYGSLTGGALVLSAIKPTDFRK
jgi:hypothetical protein